MCISFIIFSSFAAAPDRRFGAETAQTLGPVQAAVGAAAPSSAQAARPQGASAQGHHSQGVAARSIGGHTDRAECGGVQWLKGDGPSEAEATERHPTGRVQARDAVRA